MCEKCIHIELCRSFVTDREPENCIFFQDKNCTVFLPCPVGTTLYRIDSDRKSCSYHLNTRDNLYYCINDTFGVCRHLYDGKCDAKLTYKLYTMANCDAITILGNAKWLGTRVFTDKDEAERVLAEMQKKEDENWAKESRTLPHAYRYYEGYFDGEEDEYEED